MNTERNLYSVPNWNIKSYWERKRPNLDSLCAGKIGAILSSDPVVSRAFGLYC